MKYFLTEGLRGLYKSLVKFQRITWFYNFATGLLFLFPLNAVAAGRICDVRQHGAKGDGVTKDTLAIQAAIDECAHAGGGTVRLSGGTFLSAPIVLRSHVTLDLPGGSVLLGSSDHGDYPAKTEFRSPGRQSLVSATDAEDVAITGSGVIDGNGESWWIEARRFKDAGILGSEHTRPRLVVFDHCHHVRVEGVTLQNSLVWQLVPYNVDDDNIAVKSGVINTSDGDLPSKNIRTTNFNFQRGQRLSIKLSSEMPAARQMN